MTADRVLTSIPCSRALVAKVCPLGIIRTNRESLYFQVFLSIGTQSDRVAESGKANMEMTSQGHLYVRFFERTVGVVVALSLVHSYPV